VEEAAAVEGTLAAAGGADAPGAGRFRLPVFIPDSTVLSKSFFSDEPLYLLFVGVSKKNGCCPTIEIATGCLQYCTNYYTSGVRIY